MKRLLLIFFVCPVLWGTGTLDAQERRFGWLPTKHGIKAAQIATHPKYKVAPLPPAATVRQWFYFHQQGDIGSCVAFSGVKAYDAVHQKDYRGQHMKLSPLDVYQRCLIHDGNFPNDEGTYGDTLLKVLAAGSLSEKKWPYDTRKLRTLPPNTKAMQTDRARHRTVKSYAVPTRDNGFAAKQTIANIKVAVLIGSLWYGNGFDAQKVNCYTKDTKGNRTAVQRYVLPMPRGNPVGGHEVPIISYDDNMIFPDGQIGGVEIANHWEGFGDAKGCAWIPYAWAFNPRYTDDKHAIELVGPKQ